MRCFSSYSLFSAGVMSFTLFLAMVLALPSFLQPSKQCMYTLLFLSRQVLNVLSCFLSTNRHIFSYQQSLYFLRNCGDSSDRHFRSRGLDLLRLNYFFNLSTGI